MRNLAETVLKQVMKLGIHPQSFALYLQHRVRQAKESDDLIVFGECNRIQAEQFASDISQAWGVLPCVAWTSTLFVCCRSGRRRECGICAPCRFIMRRRAELRENTNSKS